MSPQVSVVIPTRDAARTIERCLRSVRAQVGTDVEVIVVDNQSSDGTAELARPLAHVVVTAGPERCAQRNLGAQLARANVVLFVDADMVLTENVCAQAANAVGPGRLAAAVVPELAFGTGFWTACRRLEKTANIGNPAVEAARAFRRDAFAAVGGYDTSLTSFEDWDLHDRVGAAGYTVGRIDALVFHDEGRLRLGTSFRKKRYYGRWAARYLAAGPRSLARIRGRSVLARAWRTRRSPVLVGGLAVLKAVEAAGFVTGAAGARWGR
jgi:glycosyltransferase involved in cell wall biosynthesis